MSYKELPEDVLVGVMLDPTRSNKHPVIHEALSNKLRAVETSEARLALKACFSFYERTRNAPNILDVDTEAKQKFSFERDEVGDEFYWGYLPHCMELADHGANTDYYVEQVLNRIARNDIANIQRKFSMTDDIPHILSTIREEVDKIEGGLLMGDKQRIGAEFAAELDGIVDGQSDPGLMTGFANLDEIIGGITNEDLFIIGARPSVGKTSFALSIADHIMSTAGPVAFYSFDMGKKQMLLRMLSFYSQLTIKEIKTKEFDCGYTEGMARLGVALNKVGQMPMFITFQHMTVNTLCRSIRTDVKKRGAKAVFVDYLQLVGVQGKDEYAAVTEVSKALKGLTHELEVPIIPLSQLRRPDVAHRNQPPTLADLRSSGQLDADASLVILLHRKPEDGGSGDLLSRHGFATIAKAQNGPNGRVNMEITKGFRWVEA